MTLIVSKFGGTSVGSLELLHKAADHVANACDSGHQVIVVLSAMGDETDRLLSLAEQISNTPKPRELDALLSTGEQISVTLLSMILAEKQYPAISMTGWQVPIKTDQYYNKARIQGISTERVSNALDDGKIVVITGFQGVDENDNITTLGRGGSDTTAVAMAVAMQADECRIYTDVDGVYTADPRIVKAAKCLTTITYEEMLEMASLGSRVLQTRAVEFAGKYNVQLRVLSSLTGSIGTLICREENIMEDALISGIAHNINEAKLTIIGVPDKPGVAYKILEPIGNANIEVDMILQNVGVNNTTDFTFTVSRDNYDQAEQILKKIADQMGAKGVVGAANIAKLSVIGVGMRSHSGIASKIFKVLADENINIQMISTSEIKVSVVVEEKYIELAVRSIHQAFGLENGVLLNDKATDS